MRIRTYALQLLLVGAMGIVAMPQTARADNDITRGEVARFDNFLDRHPEINRDLNRNPNLINDREYVARHPELREYLGQHREIREELRENPRQFMSREHRHERREERAEHKRHWRRNGWRGNSWRGDRDHDRDDRR